MKHLFVVHSNITYLAALGVICKDQLLLEDVIIISDFYVREKPVKCHLFDTRTPLSQAWKHPIKSLCPFKYSDELIIKLTNGEPFELYIAVFFHLQRICLSHPNCQGFHFIEEGLSSYCETIPFRASLSFITDCRGLRNHSITQFFSDALLLIKGYNSKLQSIPLLYNAFFNTPHVRFYGFDPNSFYGVQNKCLINLETVAQRFNFDKQYDLNNSHIWLGTNVVLTKTQTLSQYITSIEVGLIGNLKKDCVESIYIKFHPTECSVSRSATIELLHKNDIRTSIIADQTVLEVELIGSNNVSVWGVDSSLLFYASKMGARCYSVINYLTNYGVVDTSAFWSGVKKV